jgi:hypothetical protein
VAGKLTVFDVLWASPRLARSNVEGLVNAREAEAAQQPGSKLACSICTGDDLEGEGSGWHRGPRALLRRRQVGVCHDDESGEPQSESD